ncbi:C-C motif chemokine 3-like [Paramisgurnus dabryanus]|uniref:C-C motif chemokine 3-like n=1 Tax=Paramisgurnus dabryanus TaxID=90735 RepID=UPI003CCF8E79
MRLHCIFIACTVVFALSCSQAQSNAQRPNKCCFSYSNLRIPVKQVVGYYSTNFECPRSGIIFFWKSGKEICADPNERWVQKLKNLVDARAQEMTEDVDINKKQIKFSVIFLFIFLLKAL